MPRWVIDAGSECVLGRDTGSEKLLDLDDSCCMAEEFLESRQSIVSIFHLHSGVGKQGFQAIPEWVTLLEHESASGFHSSHDDLREGRIEWWCWDHWHYKPVILGSR